MNTSFDFTNVEDADVMRMAPSPHPRPGIAFVSPSFSLFEAAQYHKERIDLLQQLQLNMKFLNLFFCLRWTYSRLLLKTHRNIVLQIQFHEIIRAEVKWLLRSLYHQQYDILHIWWVLIPRRLINHITQT